MAFHEKTGRSQVDFVVSSLKQGFFCSAETATVAILPSALFNERSFARCKLGVLVYSRCCHLIVDLPFHLQDESWARP
jgi:hypothetical protein